MALAITATLLICRHTALTGLRDAAMTPAPPRAAAYPMPAPTPFQTSQTPDPRPRSRPPLTAMQLMTGLTLLALLAMALIPLHQRYLKHHRAVQAAADLDALNRQLQDYLVLQGAPVGVPGGAGEPDAAMLPVPSPVTAVATPQGTVSTTVSLMQQFYAAGWHPQAAAAFEFGAAFDADGYTLTANGKQMHACWMSVMVTNATRAEPSQTLRSAWGPDCGFDTWSQ